MTPAFDSHRFAPGRSVERLRNRCPPVDHDRILLSVPHAGATDVEALSSALGVDPTEHQGAVTQVQLAETVDRRLNNRFTLMPVLFSPAPLGLVPGRDTARPLAGVVKTGVRPVEIRLLGIEFRMSL